MFDSLCKSSFLKNNLATWFASVDVSDDKQISRTELFKFMKKTIKGYIYILYVTRQ